MTKIQLYFDQEYSNFESVILKIDNIPVAYSLTDNSILIENNIDFGIHRLTLQVVGDRIKIDDVQIDNVGLRHLIYLSWQLSEDGSRQQPQTAVWHPEQVWHLPFGNPVSFWLTIANKKIAAGDFGQDLSLKYHIYWPESEQISSHYPKLIQDFFKHNFDFHCSPISQGYHSVPWVPAQVNITSEQKDLALADVIKMREVFYAGKPNIEQYAYNLKEFDNYNKQEKWWLFYLISNGTLQIDRADAPDLVDLIDSLGIKKIQQSFVGFLPAGASIAPHRDDYNKDPDCTGLSIMYIPLSWKPGNKFKFATADTLTNPPPVLLNTIDHIHSLINDSDSERIILSITFDVKQNQEFIPPLKHNVQS